MHVHVAFGTGTHLLLKGLEEHVRQDILVCSLPLVIASLSPGRGGLQTKKNPPTSHRLYGHNRWKMAGKGDVDVVPTDAAALHGWQFAVCRHNAWSNRAQVDGLSCGCATLA